MVIPEPYCLKMTILYIRTCQKTNEGRHKRVHQYQDRGKDRTPTPGSECRGDTTQIYKDINLSAEDIVKHALNGGSVLIGAPGVLTA